MCVRILPSFLHEEFIMHLMRAARTKNKINLKLLLIIRRLSKINFLGEEQVRKSLYILYGPSNI